MLWDLNGFRGDTKLMPTFRCRYIRDAVKPTVNEALFARLTHFCHATPCIARPMSSRGVHPSVCLFARLSRSYIVSKRVSIFSYFFTIWQLYHSSFYTPNVTAVFRHDSLKGASNAGRRRRFWHATHDCVAPLWKMKTSGPLSWNFLW